MPVVLLVKDHTVLPRGAVAQSTKDIEWRNVELLTFGSDGGPAEGTFIQPGAAVRTLRVNGSALASDPLAGRVTWRVTRPPIAPASDQPSLKEIMRTILVRALALTVLCASPLLAQGYPQTREGFTASFGLGYGSAGISCDDCDTDRESAPTLHLRLGGAYRPNLILGAEVSGWSKSEDDDDLGAEARVTMATINFVAQWYPQPARGFFVNGGLGLGTIRTEIDASGLPGTFSSNTTALGYQVGTGWDFRVSPNISITPYASFFGSAGGKVEDSDEKIDFNVGQIGIGLTFH